MGGAGKEATWATFTCQEERVKLKSRTLNGKVEENVNQAGEAACCAATLGSQQAAGSQLRELPTNGTGCPPRTVLPRASLQKADCPQGAGAAHLPSLAEEEELPARS